MNRGASVRFFPLHNAVCPIANLRQYLTLLSLRFAETSRQSPLFMASNGRALSRIEFISRLRQLLSTLGHRASCYSGHSLRIGAASSAAHAGVSSSVSKLLGRWSSAAYRRYIRLPSSSIADAFRLMSQVNA